jgi:hypothetical protein
MPAFAEDPKGSTSAKDKASAKAKAKANSNINKLGGSHGDDTPTERKQKVTNGKFSGPGDEGPSARKQKGTKEKPGNQPKDPKIVKQQ